MNTKYDVIIGVLSIIILFLVCYIVYQHNSNEIAEDQAIRHFDLIGGNYCLSRQGDDSYIVALSLGSNDECDFPDHEIMEGLNRQIMSKQLKESSLLLRSPSDYDLIPLSSFKNLRYLVIQSECMTAKGLDVIKECKALTILRLRTPNIQIADVKGLLKELPDLDLLDMSYLDEDPKIQEQLRKEFPKTSFRFYSQDDLSPEHISPSESSGFCPGDLIIEPSKEFYFDDLDESCSTSYRR